MEGVQIPETFINKIENIGIKTKFFLIFLNKSEHWTSSELRNELSKACVVTLLHGSHLVQS